MADEQTGRELRRFFIELLKETNLREYHESRENYINRRRLDYDESGFLGEEAVRLLQSSDLRQIEESIMLVEGSAKAKLLWVVSPPY